MHSRIVLDQPDMAQPERSRRLAWGMPGREGFHILNGRAERFEGGGDNAALSFKWVPAGVAEYETEKHRYRLQGCSGLALNAGQPYRLGFTKPAETFVVFFPRRAARQAWHALAGTADEFPEMPTVAGRPNASMQTRLDALRAESKNSDPSATKIEELLHALLSDVAALAWQRRGQLSRIPSVRTSTREELLRRLARAHDYLVEDAGKATLSGAARAAALSPFHLIRLFDAVYGETPLAYAACQRLESARELLIRTHTPIVEVAQAAGYESRTAFDRAFHRRFGMTPGAVRSRGGETCFVSGKLASVTSGPTSRP